MVASSASFCWLNLMGSWKLPGFLASFGRPRRRSCQDQWKYGSKFSICARTIHYTSHSKIIKDLLFNFGSENWNITPQPEKSVKHSFYPPPLARTLCIASSWRRNLWSLPSFICTVKSQWPVLVAHKVTHLLQISRSKVQKVQKEIPMRRQIHMPDIAPPTGFKTTA